jgi:hypothetical protein
VVNYDVAYRLESSPTEAGEPVLLIRRGSTVHKRYIGPIVTVGSPLSLAFLSPESHSIAKTRSRSSSLLSRSKAGALTWSALSHRSTPQATRSSSCSSDSRATL